MISASKANNFWNSLSKEVQTDWEKNKFEEMRRLKSSNKNTRFSTIAKAISTTENEAKLVYASKRYFDWIKEKEKEKEKPMTDSVSSEDEQEDSLALLLGEKPKKRKRSSISICKPPFESEESPKKKNKAHRNGKRNNCKGVYIKKIVSTV